MLYNTTSFYLIYSPVLLLFTHINKTRIAF